MNNRKYLLVATLLALATLAIFAAPNAAATSFPSPHVHGWWIKLEDLDGLAINSVNYPEVDEVLIMVWNESQNCLIAYYKGPTTDDGNYTLTLVNKTKVVDWITAPTAGTYNVTILLKAYNRWMLFNWSDDINSAGITASQLESYYNETVTSWHWWRLNFTAVTNIQDPFTFNYTLYFEIPESGEKDIAHFKVYWGDTLDELLWEIDAVGDGTLNATAKRTFNISDTWVEISPTGLEGCFHIDALHNVTLRKEVYWKLYKNPGETLNIKVGDALLEFTYKVSTYAWNDIHLNETDLIHTPNRAANWEVEWNLTYYAQNDPASDGKAMFSWWDTIKDLGGVYKPPVVPVFPGAWNWTFADHAYTLLVNVSLYDICGDPKYIGDWPPVKGFIQWGRYLIRSGEAIGDSSPGYIPDHGFAPWGDQGTENKVFLWIPDITRLFGDNVTLTVEELGIQIFTMNFNTTQLLLSTSTIYFKDDLGYPIAAALSDVTKVSGEPNFTFVAIYAITSQVPAEVILKDSEPVPQPLDGAFVIIQAVQMDPINTISDDGGYIALPPYEVYEGGSTLSGEPVVDRDAILFPDGLLPVPFQLRTTGTNFTYTFRVFWSLPSAGATGFPGEAPAVEVTPDDNELQVNLTAIVEKRWGPGWGFARGRWFPEGSCTTTKKVLFAKVYELKVLLVDLCGRPLTPADYPDILALLTYKVTDFTGTEKTVVLPASGIDYEGTLNLGKVPGGIFTLRLYFKGMILDPVNETKTVELTGNIWHAPVFVFPVGDFVPQITQWDVPEMLLNISVKLQIYKDGKLAWEEPAKLTNCTGQVVFEKIPMVPAEDVGHVYDVFLAAWTSEYTPYIRPQDAGLLVMNYSVIDYLKKNVACVVDGVFPAWIYSFTAIATDHEGNILTTLETDVGDYPVIFAFNDTTYGDEWPLWLYCTQLPCYCYPNITVDFRIINATASEYDDDFNALRPGMVAASEEAKFVVSSSQTNRWINGEGDKDKYPHLFVAGARFHVVVWDGGVLVYNYSITLPRPYESGVVFFNESTYETWTLTGWSKLNYTWAEEDGDIAHPILRFTGSKNWTSGGERYDTKLEFITWEQTLEVYTLSNAGDHIVPHLNLTLIRNDVINITTFAKEASSFAKMYVNLTDIADRFSYWARNSNDGNVTSYAWNAVDEDGDGVIRIRVPVWLPTRDGSYWTETLWAGPDPFKYLDIKFGASIPYAYILAGSEWSSPSVPDTPHNYEFCVWISNSLGKSIYHHIFGYVVNWNYTEPFVEWWTADDDGNRVFYAEWYKLYEGNWIGPFYGDNDYWLGDWWNVTYWSGVAKVIHTLAMDLYCVEVYGPDLRDELIPLANQPVNTTALGYVEGSIEWGPEYTDENGKAVFKPVTSGTTTLPDGTSLPLAVDEVAYKFDVPYAGSTTINDVAYIEYMLETWYNYEDLVKPYAELAGMTPKEFVDKVLKQFALYVYINFTEDHNSDEYCVEMIWDAIKFTVEDWSGQPLKNQLVTAWLRYVTDSSGDNPAAINLPSAMAFTFENGSVILYVPSSIIYTRPTGVTFIGTPKYEVVVYWLDSYLLKQAGAIEKWTDIYTSKEDPTWGERYYAPGEGGTLQTYVYTGTFRLVGQDGSDLPPELIQKLKVKIIWPDHRITMTTLENGAITSDGTVKMVMNSDTLVKTEPAWATWRQPESPMNKPQTPIGPFTVTVYIGDTEVVTKTLRVHKARQDMPEIAVTPSQIILAVAKDITLKLSTPFGTPMAGAEVEVSGAAVETVDTAGTYTANEEGVITIPYVLLGTSTGASFTPAKITINVKTWKGMSVGYSEERDVAKSMDLVVPKIGKLVVKVVGSRGQGIAGADVTVSGPITIKGATDDSGVFSVELVEGSWSVTAEKGGKTASASATVTGGKEATVELKLDIFMTIAGWEVSISEFTGLLLLIIILIIVLFILAHEYSVWRRKRIAKALVPAKPE